MNIVTRDRVFAGIALLMAIACFTYPFVEYPHLVNSGPNWLGLDVSWQVTLSYAIDNNWIWGKDIVYTYGPLGFLSTRIGIGISRWVFLAFDIYLITNFFFLFRDYLLKATDRFIALATVFCITLLMNTSHGSDLSWVVLVFSFYWMQRAYTDGKYIYYSLVSINLALCFFIKLNAGLIGFVFLVGHIANLLLYKRISYLKSIVVLLGTVMLILLGAIVLNVNLPGYLKGAIEIVKGYNDVMYLDTECYTRTEHNVNLLFLGLLITSAVYAYYAIKEKKYSLLFFVGISACYLFLLKKQAILRNDNQHYYEYFGYATLVFLSGVFSLIDRINIKKLYLLQFVFVLFSMFMVAEYPGRQIDKSLESRYFTLGNYISQFSKYNTTPHLNAAHLRYIPQPVLAKIGKSSIDVFPWDSEYIIENGLNYKPRPVFQSFSAYTAKLQQINYNHYLKSAPEYILYDYDAVDGRYPFNDDFLVNLFICKNYTFADSFVSNNRYRLLLQKKQHVSALEKVETKEINTGLNVPIPVEWVMSMQMDIKYNLAGKMLSIFERPPVVRIVMTDRNNKNREYKVSVELLKAGIFLDRWVADTRGFETYMRNKDMLDVFNSITIKADERYFEKEIKVKYINYK